MRGRELSVKRQIHPQLAARRREVVRLTQTGRIQAAIASYPRIAQCSYARRMRQTRIDGGGSYQPLVSPRKIPKDDLRVEGAR